MLMTVYRLCLPAAVAAAVLLGTASTATAQYRRPSNEAVGENYHVELAYGWWNADPSLVISSESLGIAGSDIDLVEDLGIEQKQLGKLNLVLRPGRKHKFRFEYLPVRYEAERVIQREFIFNGQRYNVGLPVQTDAAFKIYRFGYEFDFVAKSRGYAGLLVDVKYSDIDVELLSPIGPEFTAAGAFIPTLGGVGRAYLARNFAVGGEMTFFRVPENLGEAYGGEYTDYDFYGLVNFTSNVGATLGYKSIDAFYEVDRDSGALQFKGWYFNGVVRF
jgi:hypothetical protein